jgi:hypothetical protein
MSRYFDKFVIILNIAIVIEELARVFVLDGHRYSTFYVIATPMLFVGALLFLIGWRYYIYDSVLSSCILVYRNAFQTWREYKRKKRYTENSQTTNASRLNILETSNCRAHEVIEESTRIDEQPSTFLDSAKIVYHGKFHDWIVDDVKSLQNAIVICILVLPYWIKFQRFLHDFYYFL